MANKAYERHNEVERSRPVSVKIVVLVILFLLLNLFIYWQFWRHASNRFASQSSDAEIAALSENGATKGWVADYVSEHMPKASESRAVIDDWLEEEIESMMQESSRNSTATRTNTITNNTTTVDNKLVGYSAGSGIILDGLQIESSLGSSVEAGEIASQAVSFANISGGGCTTGQTIKYNGTNWVCGIDNVADMSGTNGTTNRLSLFSSSSGLASSYLMQDGSGLWVDGGKDFHVGGVVYGDASGLYNLDGLYIVAGSITASALGDGSVQNNALADGSVTTSKLGNGAVTTAKIADGSVSVAKLGSGGCSAGQVLKWTGAGWVCANDTDTNTTYTAGSGLALSGGAFSIDATAANTWSGLQTFGNGLSIGGSTYTNLTGSGLNVSGGVLSTTLGSSIDSSELTDGAVTADKLADGSIAFEKLGQNGCSVGQNIRWNGTSWICGADADTTYGAGSGLALVGNMFELDTSAANSWNALQSFVGGVSIGGNTYTNLAGSGLTLSGGVLSSSLGASVGSAEIEDGAVTADALADGAITFAKIGQNGCANGQTLKWNGTTWACAGDVDTNTTYTAGMGLSLASGAFSIDTSAANMWSGEQTFSGGLTVNGNTYTNLAGTGLVFSGGSLATLLGNSVETAELADSAVTNTKIANGTIGFAKIGQNGCTLDQVMKWNGTAWVCADATASTGGSNSQTPYSAGSGLELNGSEFSLDTTHANTWLATQTFSGGLNIGGNTYTNLAGTGLVFSGGVLSTTLGTSVDTSELANGSVTTAKLAPGVVTLDKLAQNGCSNGQVITWNGTAWECIDTTDTDTTYTAGTGLQLASGVFSLDATATNTWSGLQTFSGGLNIGGNTYTNLAGTGLTLSGGALRAVLGTSIATSEIDDNAVTGDKILDGSITASDLADGVITADKLAQSGCANGNVLKWQTSAWVCASDVDTDTNTTYSAGTGLSFDSGTHTFSLDTTRANTWTGAQTFGAGLAIGGNTYTNLAGTGLSFNGGTLNATLGTMIDAAEITDGAVTGAKLAAGAITFDKLGANGCTLNQVMKWSGTAWACSADVDTDVDTTYSAGAGILLASNAFSLDTTAQNTWSGKQTFTGGLAIGGNTYTNLAGTGLSFSGGALNTTLGISIETNEITDGAVTSGKITDGTIAAADLADGAVTTSKLAAGAITLDKLGSNGCTTSQIIKWSGTAWACAVDTDTDTNTTYSAGAGLTLAANTFSLDLTRANNWTGLQTFSNGLNVGGSTYTSLTGTGLGVSSGTLSATLGTSIETAEITDGAITTAKILDGTVISADLADGAVTSAKILDGTITGTDIASGVITANHIADGSITSTKLSTAARKRVVTANITLQVSLLTTQEQAVFVAPSNGTITKVSFTSGNNILAVSTAGTLSVERKTATAATVASINLASLSMTALNPVAPTLGGGTSFNTGDLYTFKYAPGLVGINVSNMLVSIEYVASE